MKKNLFILTLISFMFIACSENNGVEKTNNCDLACKTWQACDQVTNTCVLKSGFCNENSQCLKDDLIVCDITSHTCKKDDVVDTCELACEFWEACNEATSSCDLKTGFCNQDSECTEGDLTICDTINHTCKKEEIINDCNSSCGDWETCNETTNTCDLRAGFCNQDSHCTEGDLTNCDIISHICKEVGTYVPPIGIPAPSFGIEEKHTMYEGKIFAAGGFNYKDAGNGPYSHYIDKDSENCTDSDNDYGDEITPRCDIPRTIPAGSVVEVHGTGYDAATTGRRYTITSEGTAELPVFLRGYAPVPAVSIKAKFGIIGEYMIIENLYFDNCTILVPHDQNGITYHAKFISIRNNEFEGPGVVTGSSGGLSVQTRNNDDPVENIVLYKNHIHHFGQHDHTRENDYHAVSVGKNAKYVWMLNNHTHHNGGDSIQVRFYSSAPDKTPQFIYVGGNDMHDDGENAVDLKGCLDVIVSQNHMYNYDGFTGNENQGSAVVVHYDTPSSNYSERAWFIANNIHDAKREGVAVSSGPDEIYFIANKIYNVHSEEGKGRGFVSWSSRNQYIINNTVSNVDIGLSYSSGSTNPYILTIENNIFNDVANDIYIQLDNSFYTNNAIINNNLFDGATLESIIEGNHIDSILGTPLFSDENNNDFSLSSDSPAVDSGILSSVYQKFYDRYGLDISKDFDGKARPQGDGWDIGAYEY